MLLEWVALCKECGEIDKAMNGDWVEALAIRHKRDHENHNVTLGIYVGIKDIKTEL